MNILGLLLKNFLGGKVALRYPQRPPIDEGYRGLVLYEQKACTGCGVCSSRCTSRAITFRGTKTTYTWAYDPGQCTFCGRCVDGCDVHALKQEADCPPIYFHRGELAKSYTSERPQMPPKAPPAPATEGAQ